MLLKVTSCIVVFISLCTHLRAQLNITGYVGSDSSKGLGGATVALIKAADSSLVKMAISDTSGHYEFALNTGGRFIIKCFSLGFDKALSLPFDLNGNATYHVPALILKRSTKQLKALTILSQKPLIEIKADKMIFNVEGSINATGSDALELLKKSPGIQVDNNDNISQKGKTGTKIYVDGRMVQLDSKSLASYLKSINSSDIEAIEIVSNPGAKYDAAGGAGIINIRLRKNTKYGTNGSISGGIEEGATLKENAAFNINYRDKKVNMFANGSTKMGDRRNTQNLYRIQHDTAFDQKSVQHDNTSVFDAKVGADFFLNSKNTIGIMATFNYHTGTWRSVSNTPIYYFPTMQYVKTLTALNTIPGTAYNNDYNVNYKYIGPKETEINVDMDYGSFRSTGSSYQPNIYFNNNLFVDSATFKNNTPININIYTAKGDVEKPLWKGKLEYGLKTSFVVTENSSDFYNVRLGENIPDLPHSNRFNYTENVNGAYINYRKQFDTSWALQAGVRTEQTNSNGILTRRDGIKQSDDSVKRTYINLFPSAALTWTVNKNNTFSLTFSRRIDRPTYQDLNPFEFKLDQLTYQKGNAFLRPQYTNNVELTHTFKGMVVTTIGYGHIKDYATKTLDTTGKNATYAEVQNVATEQIINFSIGSSTPFKKWWDGYANFWYNYLIFNGAINHKVLAFTYPGYGAYLKQDLTFAKGYSIEISGWYNGPGVWGVSGRTKGQGGMDLGIQKQILNQKATIKLIVTDVLATASPWYLYNNFGGLYLNGNGIWESRTARLTFSYRFGSNQIQSARQRRTGMDDEKKRIK